MHARSVLSVVAACACAAVIASASANAAGFELSGPFVHDGLSVYMVRGADSGGPAPLTLDQAVKSGGVKLSESQTHPIAIENLSRQSIFVPAGTLLVGGLQDQVAGVSMLLPPGGRMPLEVFCVDPFRSTPRVGEDPTTFAVPGTMLPSQMARLAMLSGPKDARATRELQQLGVWWSMDSLRTSLAQKLDEPLEPAPGTTGGFAVNQRAASTVLVARRSPATTSLPLALENEALGQADQPYLDAIGAAGDGRHTIGAVFAVDGVIKGAEIYGSHALFSAMWPNLLRAYATEAIATERWGAGAPSAETVSAYLAGGDASLVSETRDGDGHVIARSVVPKLDGAAAAASPEATIVTMLANGEVNGRPIASLAQNDDVVLAPDLAGGGWSASITVPPPPPSVPAAAFTPVTAEGHWNPSSLPYSWSNQSRPGLPGAWLAMLVAILFYGFLFTVIGRARRARRPAFVAAARVQARLVKPAVPARPRLFVRAMRFAGQACGRTGRQLAALARVALGVAVIAALVLLLGGRRLARKSVRMAHVLAKRTLREAAAAWRRQPAAAPMRTA